MLFALLLFRVKGTNAHYCSVVLTGFDYTTAHYNPKNMFNLDYGDPLLLHKFQGLGLKACRAFGLGLGSHGFRAQDRGLRKVKDGKIKNFKTSALQ